MSHSDPPALFREGQLVWLKRQQNMACNRHVRYYIARNGREEVLVLHPPLGYIWCKARLEHHPTLFAGLDDCRKIAKRYGGTVYYYHASGKGLKKDGKETGGTG